MIPSRNSNRRSIDRRLIAETGMIPAGYSLMQDTYPFQVLDQKKVMAEDSNGREHQVMKITGLIQMGDNENANGRVYSSNDVLGPAVRDIQEDISRRSVMGEYDHPCMLTDDFEVLTCDNGWQPFRNIKIGDAVWSRVNGKAVRSQVYEVIDQEYEGEAYRLFNNNIMTEHTPGHKLVIQPRQDRDENQREEFATVEYVYNNRKQFRKKSIPKTAQWETSETACFTIKGLDVEEATRLRKQHLVNDIQLDAKKFMAFLGVYLAEGCCAQGCMIYQKNEGGKEVIRNILNGLHEELQFNEVQNGFYCGDRRLVAYLSKLGDKYTKHIPSEVKSLDKECLTTLIRGFILGDGRSLSAEDRNSRALSNKNGLQYQLETLDIGTYSRQSMFTVSEQLINDLHECVTKVGYSARLSKIEQTEDRMIGERTIKAESRKTLYQLHLSRTENIYLDDRHLHIEKITHKGNIYCLGVTHRSFYMRMNGCAHWTGNCDAKIHLDRISHLMTKIWMEGKKVYGEAEVLHKLPLGACLRGLFEHKIQVGISSRGVGDMEIVEHNGKEIYRVLPGYSFVTWDVVAEPSVTGAILNISEGLHKRVRPIQEKKAMFRPEVYQDMLVKEINKYFGVK